MTSGRRVTNKKWLGYSTAFVWVGERLWSCTAQRFVWVGARPPSGTLPPCVWVGDWLRPRRNAVQYTTKASLLPRRRRSSTRTTFFVTLLPNPDCIVRTQPTEYPKRTGACILHRRSRWSTRPKPVSYPDGRR